MLLSSLALFGRLPLLAPDGEGGGGDGSGAGTGGGTNDGAGGDGSGAGNNGGNAGGTDGSGGGDGGFKAITTQEAFDAAIKDRLARQERSLRQAITDQVKADLKAAAETAAAKEQGDFKALYEAEQQKVADLKARIDQLDRDALRAKVAAKHKLPDDLVEFLKGDDEAALTESAKRLAKHAGTRSAPETEAGAGNRGGAGRSEPADPKKAAEKAANAFLPPNAVAIPT